MVGASREADVELRLERNQNYYKEGQPYIDGYKGISLGDDAIRIAAFVNGQTDFLNYQWFGRPVDLDAVIAELGEDAVTGVPNPVTYGMATHIHTEVEPYTDPRVRTAVHLAADREQLIALSLGELVIGGPIAVAIAPYGRTEDELRQLPGYRSGDLRQEDLAESRKLLEATGVDLDGFPPLDIWAPDASDYAQVLQQNFGEVGINIGINELTTADALAARQNREFSMIMLGQQGASDPDLLYNDLHTTGGQNYGNFSNPEFDALVEKGRAVFDVEERKAIYDEAQDRLLNEWNPRSVLVVEHGRHHIPLVPQGIPSDTGSDRVQRRCVGHVVRRDSRGRRAVLIIYRRGWTMPPWRSERQRMDRKPNSS